jgi:hypothetical protein
MIRPIFKMPYLPRRQALHRHYLTQHFLNTFADVLLTLPTKGFAEYASAFNGDRQSAPRLAEPGRSSWDEALRQ